MSIFETFYISFKADSAQLKKEIDEVKKKTNEYTESSKKSEDQTRKTDNEFSNFAKSLAKVAAAYFSVGAVVGGFKNTLTATTDISNLSRELGINIEVLDRWSRAVKNLGGDAASFQNSIRSFAESWNTTPERALAFIPQFQQFLKRLNPTQAQIFGKSQGFASADIAFLRETTATELQAELERQKRIGVTTEEDAKAVREFNKATGQLEDAFDKLYRTVAMDLLPPLTSLAQYLTDIVEFAALFNEDPNKKVPWTLFKELLLPKNSINKFKEALPNISEPNKGEFQTSYYVPPSIPPVSNSQSLGVHTGDINIVTQAKDPKGISDALLAGLDQKVQLWQSNSFFDNNVVV
jgi:hypothetical protein